jgi:hypothetical protein
VALTAALGAAGAARATTHGPAGVQLSRHPVAQSRQWRKYVLGRGNGLVYPKAVRVVAGSPGQVENPDGLRTPGGGVTTIHSAGLGTPRLQLDLGIDAGGYVEIGVTTSTGARVRLGYSEARRFLTPDGDSGVPANGVGIPFVTDPSLSTDDDPGGRYDDFTGTGALRSAGIRGAERWISLQLTGPGTVSIDYVRVRTEHLHPSADDYVGHFLSSNGLLNRIWYAGVYTFTLDSFKDLRPGHDHGHVVVTDGAKRDRLVWIGDLAVETLLGNYALREAPRIIRNSIDIFSCEQDPDGELAIASQVDSVCPGSPDPVTIGGQRGGPDQPPVFTSSVLPEYTAWWVIALHDYWWLTGDRAFTRRMLPVARRGMAYFASHLDAKGLYSTPAASINWHPFDYAAGEDTHTNATIYRALGDLAQLERRVGAGSAAARKYERRAVALRRAMLRHLWDPRAGAFLLNSSDPLRNHTQDAQVEAILDGIITGRRARSALRFIQDNLETRYGVRNGQYNNDPYMSNYISPYISFTQLLVYLKNHATSSALDLLRREWGRMVDTDPNTTLWEKMSFDGDAASYSPGQVGSGTGLGNMILGPGFTSLAQGWSGGPVPALSGYVLGIRAAGPGFATWTVQPEVGDLRWAQGRAPTPHGPVISRWHRGRRDRSFTLTAGGPRGTAGTVYVPLLGRRCTIARDGRIVTPDAVIRGYARFDHVRGVHTWAWAGRGASRR